MHNKLNTLATKCYYLESRNSIFNLQHTSNIMHGITWFFLFYGILNPIELLNNNQYNKKKS